MVYGIESSLPRPPGDPGYQSRDNLAWINRERIKGETDDEVCQRMARQLAKKIEPEVV